MALAGSPILPSHYDAFLSRPRSRKSPQRDDTLDFLVFAAAAASGPHMTRNHAGHAVHPPRRFDDPALDQRPHPHVGRQAPRGLRSQIQEQPLKDKENIPEQPAAHSSPLPAALALSHEKTRPESAVRVRCMARTRIPTPHGIVFLHLYHNNRDSKEHLAIVIDPAQFSTDTLSALPPIRSHSLDAIWSENETDEDRILRGAYVGRLSSDAMIPSRPIDHPPVLADAPLPLVRIHSECFTGETIASMRCDCGEQLDEAIRIISQPIQTPSSTIPGRGVVVYLRQEGRGIGLLSKIRAYNLQDIGHDTVTANLLLGHKADERAYDVAAAILRDLGLGSEQGEAIRLLTNNPDKVAALEKEGLGVLERVPMVPRSWKCQSESSSDAPRDDRTDLDKYLRTKVLRMGHMLPLSMVDG